MADDFNNINVDVLQAPADLSAQLERVTQFTDENTDRIWDLESAVKGPFGVDQWVQDLNNEIKKLKNQLEVDAPEAGDNAVPVIDPDQDENLDGGSIPDSEIDSPVSNTIDWNAGSEDELVLYNVFTDNDNFTVAGADDNNSWLSGLGFGMVDKGDTSTLKWTTFDGIATLAGQTQKSLEINTTNANKAEGYAQIYKMDIGATLDPDVTNITGYDMCVRDVAGGAVDWLDLTEFADYLIDGWGGGSHLDFGGDAATAHDGQYWHLGGTYISGGESCFGKSIGRSGIATPTDDRAIDLENSRLYDQSSAPLNAITLDWHARQLEGGDWTVTSATAAGNGTGALKLTNGGVYAKLGFYSEGSGGTPAGYCTDGTRTASLCGGGFSGEFIYGARRAVLGITDQAAFFENSTTQVEICEDNFGRAIITSGDVDVQSGDYYHSSNQGQTITNWFGGGILTGGSIVEIDADDLQATDKLLVYRP